MSALAAFLPAEPRLGQLSALHRALADFGAPAPFFTPFAAAPEPPPSPLEPEAPAIDVEAAVSEAVAEAEARLRETLEQEHRAAMSAAVEQALASERARHAREMESTLSGIGAEAGAAIEKVLGGLGAQVAAEISASCAKILLPVAGEAVAARAVVEMAAAVREALQGEAAPRVTVCGPRLLLSGLKARLGGEAEAVQWRESLGFDLSASFDGQVVEARLGLWADALGGRLSAGEAAS